VSVPTLDARTFAWEIAEHLSRTPRQLPSKYFYDALGSALFDAICELPWYGVTRAESALLARHAAVIVAPFGSPLTIAELGCGSGAKLEIVLQAGGDAVRRLHLVDISGAALEAAAARVGAYAPDGLTAWEGTYESGLDQLASAREPGHRVLCMFLGSNIGNFDPPAARALLARIRASLRPGDGLLLGSDLVKPERELLLAYDDPLGVTAAFNRNLLRRINDELGGTFDLHGFAHRAIWNETLRRVEMHLVSQRRQTVRIEAAGLALALEIDEPIWTESSYKYEPAAVMADGLDAGFRESRQWIDERARFALTCFSV
jgi:L-histidine N-alpha-methyltransferase